jgi:very-short-patch-repair endonuclease
MGRRFIRYRDPLHRSRLLRREQTPAEKKLWFEFLREQPEKFTRQKPLGQYIADFYCSACKLVVEVDGDSHFVDDGRRDATRTAMLNLLGVRVIRFTNEDVMERFEAVCMEIQRVLRMNPPRSPSAHGPLVRGPDHVSS